jgi:hypothetical protein
VIKPATLLRFFEALIRCKYHRLYSSRKKGKLRPKGPQERIRAIGATKLRNPG